MLAAAMADLTLEIVEGPGAGRQLVLDKPALIGRSPDADLPLEDGQASRRHAQVSPASDGSAVVEDLGSANGTFVNQNELVGPARLDPGDELLIGVTLIQVRSQQQVAAQPSALRAVPAGLAITPRQPDYVNPEVIAAELGDKADKGGGPSELDKWRDVNVRRRAQLAPLAFTMLIALALCVYFATK
jgi:pSer/pThr/pTyr-binding forkhead associated (FHA) protein